MRLTLCASVLLLLASCGGSSGGNSADETTLTPDDIARLPVSAPSDLPTSGRASYSGFLTVNLPTTSGAPQVRTAYRGDLALDVSFAAGAERLSGGAGGFTATDGGALTGRLRISGADLSRTTDPDASFTFATGLGGTLDHAGVGPLAIDGEMTGDFRGAAQEGVSGVVFGDVTTGAGQDIFDGSFAAIRD